MTAVIPLIGAKNGITIERQEIARETLPLLITLVNQPCWNSAFQVPQPPPAIYLFGL